MKVVGRDIEWESVPDHVRPYLKKEQTRISAGTVYDVYAVSVYDGVLFLLTEDDVGTVRFRPSLAFEPTAECHVPISWRCNFDLGDRVSLVLGPGFISDSLKDYNATVDGEYEKMAAIEACMSDDPEEVG